jgi:hypothetical protein
MRSGLKLGQLLAEPPLLSGIECSEDEQMHVVFKCPHVFLKAVIASNEIPSVTPELLRINHESLASHATLSVGASVAIAQ